MAMDARVLALSNWGWYGMQINVCNGRHCGDTFSGPNKANKPYLWTENWTAQ